MDETEEAQWELSDTKFDSQYFTMDETEEAQWELSDTKFDSQFVACSSLKIRHTVGRLLGSIQYPDLNEYACHLARGLKIGALPKTGCITSSNAVEKLENHIHDEGLGNSSTDIGKKMFRKICLEDIAGKKNRFPIHWKS